jgi:hypothetical protein
MILNNSQVGASVIMPRRNFLIRALGFTAAGATMTLPIVTVADAKARVGYHAKELEKAFQDYYAGLAIDVRGNGQSLEQVRQMDFPAVLTFTASFERPYFWSPERLASSGRARSPSPA